MYNQNYLNHIGVLGMKWGRRKGPSARVAINSEDHNKKIALKNKKVREMTNAELRTLNERLQLEQTYKALSSKDVKKGASYVNSMLKYAKTANEVYALYNSPIGKQIKSIITKPK